MSMLNLFIAGKQKQLEVERASDLLTALSLPTDGRGIAIAINDAVVPKSSWTMHELQDGDRIEIVTAVQGG